MAEKLKTEEFIASKAWSEERLEEVGNSGSEVGKQKRKRAPSFRDCFASVLAVKGALRRAQKPGAPLTAPGRCEPAPLW
jgi:hypothetical protein